MYRSIVPCRRAISNNWNLAQGQSQIAADKGRESRPVGGARRKVFFKKEQAEHEAKLTRREAKTKQPARNSAAGQPNCQRRRPKGKINPI